MGRKDGIVLSREEEMFFDLLFNKNLSVEDSLKYLRESNVAATRTELVRFKNKALETVLEQNREEHMSELILTSFERTKIEFDDLIKETKNILDSSKGTNPELTLAAIKELRGQLETALSQQNKTAEQLIQAMREQQKMEKETLQLHEVLKQEKERWLSEYGATITTDKRIVFETPTPEFVDYVTRWKFQKEMKDGKVISVEH
jgi:hypothetical protein